VRKAYIVTSIGTPGLKNTTAAAWFPIALPQCDCRPEKKGARCEPLSGFLVDNPVPWAPILGYQLNT